MFGWGFFAVVAVVVLWGVLGSFFTVSTAQVAIVAGIRSSVIVQSFPFGQSSSSSNPACRAAARTWFLSMSWGGTPKAMFSASVVSAR